MEKEGLWSLDVRLFRCLRECVNGSLKIKRNIVEVGSQYHVVTYYITIGNCEARGEYILNVVVNHLGWVAVDIDRDGVKYKDCEGVHHAIVRAVKRIPMDVSFDEIRSNQK